MKKIKIIKNGTETITISNGGWGKYGSQEIIFTKNEELVLEGNEVIKESQKFCLAYLYDKGYISEKDIRMHLPKASLMLNNISISAVKRSNYQKESKQDIIVDVFCQGIYILMSVSNKDSQKNGKLSIFHNDDLYIYPYVELTLPYFGGRTVPKIASIPISTIEKILV